MGRIFLASTMLVTLGFSQNAYAQAADATGDFDIIVTATKRSERLQDVPATITAQTSQQLAAAGVTSLFRLTDVIPGMVVNNVGGQATLYMRGVGAEPSTGLSESPIAIYLDGVYDPASTILVSEFGDVERIEVLKGPQGTLYGRNTTGGAINVITRTPTVVPTANFDISYGNYNEVNAKFYMSGGSGKIAASLSGYVSDRDGFFYNRTTGRKLDDKHAKGLRGKVKVDLNDDWNVVFAATYSNRRDYTGGNYVVFGPLAQFSTPAALGGLISTNPQFTYNDADNKVLVRNIAASATIKGSFGDLNFSSITGYIRDQQLFGNDLDASNLPLIQFRRSPFEQDSYSQEFQLASEASGRFSWILGGYAAHQKGAIKGPVVVGGNLVTLFTGALSGDNLSLFGEAHYKLTSDLEVQLGARLSREEKKTPGVAFFIPDASGVLPAAPQAPGIPLKKSFTNVSPKVTISYKRPGLLLYVTASRGFKSGTFPTTSPGPALKPEKMGAFEIGGKHTLLDGLVTFNWSGFYYKYKNLQVTYIDATGGASGGATLITQNASTEGHGVDGELTLRPLRNLRLTTSVEYLKSKYGQFLNPAYFVPNTAFPFGFSNGTLTDLKGFRPPKNPKLGLTASAQYSIPIGNQNLSFFGSYTYNSGYWLDVGHVAQQKAFGVLNGRVDFDLNNTVTIYAYGRNLSNERYVNAFTITQLSSLARYSDPRTYGVGITAKF